MSNHSDPSVQMLACTYISRQLDKLMSHLQGARTRDDVEDVHQVRVACRRMHAAMRIFAGCFEEKFAANWQKRLKKLLKSFGTARDLDVQILFLAQQLEQLSADQKKMRPGIRRMLLRWQQQRDAVQPGLIKAIDTLQKKQVLTNIHLQVEKILFLLKPLKPSIQSPQVYRLAFEQIREHIDSLMSWRTAFDNPEDVSGHHKMRIAAKKLRYVMEICTEAMDNQLKPAIKTVKKLQTLLGDIHDCDVWDDELNTFIESEGRQTIEFYGSRRPFSRILPGLEYLQSERQAYRRQLYERAYEFIEQLENDAFWQTLLDSLQMTCLQEEATNDAVKDNQNQQTAETDENSNSL